MARAESILTQWKCPLCQKSVPLSGICSTCGSLEGLLPIDSDDAAPCEFRHLMAAVQPQNTLFGFDWASGAVAPFVGAPDDAVCAALELCGVGVGTRLVDLGSGDGRVCIAAAQRGALSTGIELDADLCARATADAAQAAAKFNASTAGTPEDVAASMSGTVWGCCTFLQKDLFTVSLESYDVVMLFLLPSTLEKLGAALEKAVRRGGIVCSFVWPVPLLEPHRLHKYHGIGSNATPHSACYVYHATMDSESPSGAATVGCL